LADAALRARDLRLAAHIRPVLPPLTVTAPPKLTTTPPQSVVGVTVDLAAVADAHAVDIPLSR
jgi:hypothetical protein